MGSIVAVPIELLGWLRGNHMKSIKMAFALNFLALHVLRKYLNPPPLFLSQVLSTNEDGSDNCFSRSQGSFFPVFFYIFSS
jgi:hypothetical protein